MPDQAILFMGVRVKADQPDPVVTPQPVRWRTPSGDVITTVPSCMRLEDAETDQYESETVFGFRLNGRYFSKIIDKVNPEDPDECGNGHLLKLDLEQLIQLRESVREWFPGADVIVTTVFH